LNISVIGDGGWGTTLAILLSNKGYNVILWSAFEENALYINRHRENLKYLPGVKIPQTLKITSSLGFCIEDAEIVIFAVPSNHLRSVAGLLGRFNIQKKIILSASKGIEENSFKRMSEVLKEVLSLKQISVVSGPNIAMEIARGLPASTVVASENESMARMLQEVLITDRLRVYTSTDVVGVETGGALKNIIAIAAGVCDGLQFGTNAKAALMVRGMLEITRLGMAMGGKKDTFFGLSGMGDLITTCLSPNSRNRTFGETIAKGGNPLEMFSKSIMAIEGVRTAKATVHLALKYNVEMPITEQVYQIVFNKKDPTSAVDALMTRLAKTE
jgi:glycerol-3-phosphate dehydrogenase (NAD(P)+)